MSKFQRPTPVQDRPAAADASLAARKSAVIRARIAALDEMMMREQYAALKRNLATIAELEPVPETWREELRRMLD